MKNSFLVFLNFVIISPLWLTSQVTINGFIFETGNRGYINQAVVTLSNERATEYYGQLTTDETGAYKFTVSGPGTYLLTIDKKPYFDHREVVVIEPSQGNAVYLKHELKRNPGYIFEITIAEKDAIPDASKDALKGALVEVYNNTKREEVMVIEDLQSPEFKVDLLKGNHYTLLIRKNGFLSKRMEAFVDVEGCILCFEGIGNVTPGVSDNLTDENSMGVLLANVEMDRYFAGKVIGLNDIYYDYGKSRITKEAGKELLKVAEFLKDNPALKVELGSHTDSRGGATTNMTLSEKRARAAVEFLVNKGGIAKEKIAAKGYGESNLTNNCADGVQCTDDEHRLNRRTELKVLDVINEGMQRRLRQMKAEEYMDEILADLDNAGQIKVKAGQTIDEAIAEKGEMKSAIIPGPGMSIVDKEKTKEEDIVSQNISEKTLEPIQMSPQKTGRIIANAPSPDQHQVEEVQGPAVEQAIMANTATSPKEESETLIDDFDMDLESKEIVDVTNEAPQAVDISQKVDMAKGEGNIVAEVPESPSLPTPSSKTVLSSPAAKVVAQQSVQTTDNTAVEEWIRPGASNYRGNDTVVKANANKYSPEYSGYKVVVIFSRYELPKEHSIYSMYDDVDIYTTADGNKLYMLGAYKTKKEAYGYMNKTLKRAYPHSYVVGFEDGIRIY